MAQSLVQNKERKHTSEMGEESKTKGKWLTVVISRNTVGVLQALWCYSGTVLVLRDRLE